jgi:hypothetical protein
MIKLVCDEALISDRRVCACVGTGPRQAGEQRQRAEEILDFCFHDVFLFDGLCFV